MEAIRDSLPLCRGQYSSTPSSPAIPQINTALTTPALKYLLNIHSKGGPFFKGNACSANHKQRPPLHSYINLSSQTNLDSNSSWQSHKTLGSRTWIQPQNTGCNAIIGNGCENRRGGGRLQVRTSQHAPELPWKLTVRVGSSRKAPSYGPLQSIHEGGWMAWQQVLLKMGFLTFKMHIRGDAWQLM